MAKLRFSALVLCMVMLVNLVSCGYILYPERKGQTGGKIDAGVAVLDGLGLLFFIIPGVIAYAVDFSGGYIYLPGTSSSANEIDDGNGLNVVKVDGKIDLSRIEKVLHEQANLTIDLDNTYILSEQASSVDGITSHVRWIY